MPIHHVIFTITDFFVIMKRDQILYSIVDEENERKAESDLDYDKMRRVYRQRVKKR